MRDFVGAETDEDEGPVEQYRRAKELRKLTDQDGPGDTIRVDAQEGELVFGR